MFRTWLDRLPRWPGSVRQPLENPLQPDRLPDASGVELEYPSYRHTPAEDRRHNAILILLFVATSFAVGGVGYFSQRFSSYSSLFIGPAAFAAFGVFAATDLERARPAWRWAVYFGLIPLLFVAAYTFIVPWAYLVMCVLAAARLADLFASHYFWLKTSAPLPRSRAVALRKLWAGRFAPTTTPVKGLELYGLASVAIAAVIVAVFLSEHDRPTLNEYEFPLEHPYIWANVAADGYVVHVPALAAGLAALMLLPWLAEHLLAFLFNRRPVGLATMIRAFREALSEWLAYNRHGASAPGIFQSPSGTYRARRRMTWATVTLFACLLVQLSDRERSTWRDLRRRFSAPPPGAGQGAPVPGETPPLFEGDDRFGAAQPSGPTVRLVSYQPEGGRRRTNAERQEELLRELRAPATPPEAKPDAPVAGPPGEAASPLERTEADRYLRNVHHAASDLLSYSFVPVVFAVMPTLYVLACCFATSARVAGLWGQEFRTDSGRKLLNTETWDDLVARVRNSGDRVEKESVLLGVNAWDDTPVIVPRSVFSEHAHLLGDSGSGKTSLGMVSLITQFIRFADCSVVVIDLKGDDIALMEGCRIEAERANLRFRWFTNELDRPTYVFNPLAQSHLPNLTLYQRTDVLTAALGLQYGSDYGRGYFSDANAEMLHHALKARPAGVASFRELAEVFGEKEPFRKVSEPLKMAGAHLGAVITRLGDCEPLNGSKRDGCPEGALRAAIDMPDVFRTPQVVYFHLSSALGMASTAEMARLAVYSLLTAAKSVAQAERKQVFLFIDEFQRIVSNNLELFLQQARSMNIGVILANQTLGDLKTAGVDLIPTVRANTRFRQIFSASDLVEQEEIIKTSGETTVWSRSFSRNLNAVLGPTGSMSLGETITPRLRVNDVLLASDHPQQSIVHVRRGKGYAQFGGLPFVMTSAYHITADEHERRKRAPWPDRPGETITPTLKKEGAVAATPIAAKVDPVIAPAEAPAPPPTPAPTNPVAAPPQDDPLAALWRAQQAKKQQAVKKTGPRGRKKAGENDAPAGPGT